MKLYCVNFSIEISSTEKIKFSIPVVTFSIEGVIEKFKRINIDYADMPFEILSIERIKGYGDDVNIKKC